MKKILFLIYLLSILSTKSFAMLKEEGDLGNSPAPMKKFLVVANGEWDQELVEMYMPTRFVVALDGAAYKFYKSSLIPHIILGDLDSLLERYQEHGIDYFNVNAALQYFNATPLPADENTVQFEEYKDEASSITYIRAHSQNYTDLSKGVEFCLTRRTANEPIDIIIACALGGERVDHALGNFSVLKKYSSSTPEYRGVNVRIVNKLQIVEFMNFQNQENDLEALNIKTFTGNIGDKCGFFGFPSAKFESKGLCWELDGFHLEIGVTESACNELKDDTVFLKIIEGKALIMLPNIDFKKR